LPFLISYNTKFTAAFSARHRRHPWLPFSLSPHYSLSDPSPLPPFAARLPSFVRACYNHLPPPPPAATTMPATLSLRFQKGSTQKATPEIRNSF